MTMCVDERIQRSTERYYKEILGLPDWPVRTRQRLRREFEIVMFERLRNVAGALDNRVVLDLGCGWGGVVLQVAAVAQAAFGIEPDPDRLAIARELVAESGRRNATVTSGLGEALPFPDAHFDVVASYQVLEHVTDPSRVVAEVFRVLKPDGVFHFSTPNYLSFREPHYKLLWFPLMPKPLARLYLRMRGRNPEFINHIQYVNPVSIRRMLRTNGFVTVDIHEQRARAKMDREVESLLRSIPLAQAIKPVLRLMVTPVVGLYLLFLNQDQEYVARKR